MTTRNDLFSPYYDTQSPTHLCMSPNNQEKERFYRVHYNQSLMSHLSVKESRACQPQLVWYDSTTWHLVSSWGTIKNLSVLKIQGEQRLHNNPYSLRLFPMSKRLWMRHSTIFNLSIHWCLHSEIVSQSLYLIQNSLTVKQTATTIDVWGFFF